MTPVWILLNPAMTMTHLGLFPNFLSEEDPRRARDQINANYQHGGGWDPQKGFKLLEGFELEYPGDPPLKPIAVTSLREECVVVYDYDYVAIIQPDKSFEVCRVD